MGSHLARAPLDDHETVLADGSGLLGEGEGGTGVGALKGLVICSDGLNSSSTSTDNLLDTATYTEDPEGQCCTTNMHAGP